MRNDDDDSVWKSKWQEQVDQIDTTISYQNSSVLLRELIRTGLLRFTDVRDRPERFFLAHRMLVGLHSPGFSIRFTVQYNLFTGTILGLGGPEQVAELENIQAKGQLGCFALTERLAGVNSGLVVQTTATWNEAKRVFVLDSPTEGSCKYWISQGLTAEKATVIADLRVNNKSYGPHGFLIDMRSADGALVTGITVGDMGRKTTGNDLDNAWIRFSKVILPKSALLNRFADIRDGQYVQTTHEKMRIEVIGQRLLTGRLAVAQASLEFAKKLFAQTATYTNKKKCWSPSGDVTLGSIPHIGALFKEANQTLALLEDYCLRVERDLSKTLEKNEIPSARIVQALAVAKITAVENAISLSFRLKQEVGSYALMGGTGFEHLDFLQCCKFAEGDSRILMHKLARDQVKSFSSGVKGSTSGSERENELCQELMMKVASGGKDGWDSSWKIVFDLASTIQRRVISEWTGSNLLNESIAKSAL